MLYNDDGWLYIVLFLHQTTTVAVVIHACRCCISYYSYIKPQLLGKSSQDKTVVYRTIPTSNHNYSSLWKNIQYVVYRTIPTSNHNALTILHVMALLYIVLFLHQTTTLHDVTQYGRTLYIVLFLHQTTTFGCTLLCSFMLYIVLFLHQTTTI